MYDFSDILLRYYYVIIKTLKYPNSYRDVSHLTFDSAGFNSKYYSKHVYIEVLKGDEMPKAKNIKVYHCDQCGEVMIGEKGLCEKCLDELENYPIDEDEYPEDSWYGF